MTPSTRSRGPVRACGPGLCDSGAMLIEPESNDCTESTTWEWRHVKLTKPPQAMSTSEPASTAQRSLLPWPRSKPMTIVLKYRGGPEGWVEVRARGRIWRRPGDTAVYDLIRTLWGYGPK